MRVLLVDDHALFAQSLAIVLSDFPSIEQFSNIKSVDEIEANCPRKMVCSWHRTFYKNIPTKKL